VQHIAQWCSTLVWSFAAPQVHPRPPWIAMSP
jgi:hypothetical protein